jgi:hypothetical protein
MGSMARWRLFGDTAPTGLQFDSNSPLLAMEDATGNEVTWATGQRIRVTCPKSKHYRRYAVVTAVLRLRLAVTFEDGRPGKFIDKSRAAIVDRPPSIVTETAASNRSSRTHSMRPAVIHDNGDHDMIIVGNPAPDIPATEQSREDNPRTNGSNRDMTELTRLLDHMAFTVATLISSNADDPTVVSSTLAEFQAAVRDNTRMISQQRRDRDQGLN